MRIPRFSVKKQGDNALFPSLRGGQQPDVAIHSEHTRLLRFLLRPSGFAGQDARNDDKNQQGSAIIWILIAIAIFAALNFAITSGSRTGTQNISKEQARLAATEILDYARAIKQAVQTLQINGCSDTDISFENSVVAGYEHTPPARDECKVFHPAGGGLNYLKPEEEWMDGTSVTENNYQTWFTNSRSHIIGLGIDSNGGACSSGTGDCKELITGIPFIKKEICMAVNKKLGWGTDDIGTPHRDTGISYGHRLHPRFNGLYNNAGANMGTATPSNYSNIITGCIEGDNSPPSGTYHFFQVLIVR